PIRAAICRRSGSAWTAGEGWRGDSGRASALSSARQIPDHDFGIVPERDFSGIELSHGIYLRQRPGESYKFVCDDDSAREYWHHDYGRATTSRAPESGFWRPLYERECPDRRYPKYTAGNGSVRGRK